MSKEEDIDEDVDFIDDSETLGQFDDYDQF